SNRWMVRSRTLVCPERWRVPPYGVLSAALIFGKVGQLSFLFWFQRVRRKNEEGAAAGLRGIVAAGKQDGANGWMRAVATQFLILVLTLVAAEVVLRVIDLRYLRLDE